MLEISNQFFVRLLFSAGLWLWNNKDHRNKTKKLGVYNWLKLLDEINYLSIRNTSISETKIYIVGRKKRKV